MRLEISREALEAIRAEADASPEVEVCGLLLGDGLRVEEVRACRNVADDPATAFEIDPQALIAAYKAARSGGRAIIGHYHSHPSGRAEPSVRDKASALGDGAVWIIVGRDSARAWQSNAAGQFDSVSL
ncbi:MAG: M67 family peptidase [Sphingomonas sp.]|uniref:M67 family metallopeptidase n=1 Tax=Sphingomonas sp. TaxID=28214 RepID=UPI001219C705|nr:M67 family metallopeptidase [Sphingomonas sp.]THD36834.1 MAG: M67 family peptidase [Sphingomonas sp.]